MPRRRDWLAPIPPTILPKSKPQLSLCTGELFHEIGFAYYPYKSLALDDGQATDFVGEHQIGRVAQRRFRGNSHYLVAHGILDSQRIEQFLLGSLSISEGSQQSTAE
jgi:hypothetical protein